MNYRAAGDCGEAPRRFKVKAAAVPLHFYGADKIAA
jgi:hypothetical protein